MSKRFIFPQQNGERKRAKLDVSISDHNFPLSQNVDANKELDTWGDDNDDEILLLASQACEQAYSNDSMLPNYSICMQPSSTSTQMFDPGPSTSKSPFTFKTPSAIPSHHTSTSLKDKCNRISSPLPGLSSQITNNNFNLNDDKLFNDKVYKKQDSDNMYKQLLQLQEENNKLKSENGKLLEKCVTKEGECSILRTQLKSCQIAVDNARMERIKAQEKVQLEWTEKLKAANSQMHDLRTQLDFKNLEIISVKERCRMLESNKVKLTQVMVGGNDISSSHRNHGTIQNESLTQLTKRAKMSSTSAQTDQKVHFLKLNKTCRSEQHSLNSILPIILEPTTEQHSLLEYNEKLQKHMETNNKCRIFSTFHRIPSTPAVRDNRISTKSSSLHDDLMRIATEKELPQDTFFNNLCTICNTGFSVKENSVRKLACFNYEILNSIQDSLGDVKCELEAVSHKMTTAFQREMDERYIESTTVFIAVHRRDLLSASSLFKEEQAIWSRRMTATLSFMLHDSRDVLLFTNYEQREARFVDDLNRICVLLDTTSCAQLYSGLLLSITHIAESLIKQTNKLNTKLLEIIKILIVSRPNTFVSYQLLNLIRRLSLTEGFLTKMCPGNGTGNLKLDYDQGVLLYKKDSCYLQILVKQVETCLKCIESQNLLEQARDVTRNLIVIFSNVNDGSCLVQEQSRCDCQLVLVQVIVYALRICAVMLNDIKESPDSTPCDLLSQCTSGIQTLYQCVLRDVEFSSQLAHYEGHLALFCEIMARCDLSEGYGNMLSELSGTFQSSPEDMTSSFHNQGWIKSFESFSMAD